MLRRYIIICIFIITACGKSAVEKKFEEYSKSEDAKAADLVGKWQSPCIPKSKDASYIKIAIIEKNRILDIKLTYIGKQCETAIFQEQILSDLKYSLNEDTKDQFKLKTTLFNYKIAIVNKEALIQSNKTLFCGYDDWNFKVPKDITAEGCGRNTNLKGVLSYDIAKIDGNRLYFGDKSSEDYLGDSEETRPSDYNSDYYTRR